MCHEKESPRYIYLQLFMTLKKNLRYIAIKMNQYLLFGLFERMSLVIC